MFKDIKGYEGKYVVSNNGSVYSLLSNNGKAVEISNSGYGRVSLWDHGKGKHYSIHRLVAEAFIPNPDSLPQVNHKDGNKLNNNVDNLEWCSFSENMKHAYKNGLVNPKTKRVIQYSDNYTKIKEWDSIADASKELGINHANIITVCKQNTNRKYAGGFIWRYAE